MRLSCCIIAIAVSILLSGRIECSVEKNEEHDVLASQASVEDSNEAEETKPPYDPTLVEVKQGKIRGFKEVAANGNEFYSFRGIPFAQPPVGELRFEPTVPVNPWEDVLIAKENPSPCIQITIGSFLTMANLTIIGEEDCLYLNVFSPMYEQKRPSDPLLPVMVYIHGGGYFAGSAHEYGPYQLMTRDIVLVVIQYRLGTLGFLSTEDDVAPGNMGLLDQTQALKWVQENCVSFGGNPLQITIFGESAGGASVHLQMLSHRSLGLFHRAIMQSGTALSSWAMATNHRKVAYFVAAMLHCDEFAEDLQKVNCTVNDDMPGAYEVCVVERMSSEQILECLKEADPRILAESSAWFNQVGVLPLMMGPRVDDGFLIQEPEKLIKEGRFKKMDVMMGVNTHEGGLFVMPIFASEGLRSALRFKFETMAPTALDFTPGDVAPLNQTIKLFDHYIGNPEFDASTFERLTALFGDKLIWYPSDTVAHFLATHPANIKRRKKTYFYEFAYRGEWSLHDIFKLDLGKEFVGHVDELAYLFGAFQEKFVFGGEFKTEEDKKVSELMVEMWTNFAATGYPMGVDTETKWEAYNSDNPQVLIIDQNPHMSEPNYKGELRKFWRQMPLKSNIVLFPSEVANLTVTTVVDEGDVPSIMETLDGEAASSEKTSEVEDGAAGDLSGSKDDESKDSTPPETIKDEL